LVRVKFYFGLYEADVFGQDGLVLDFDPTAPCPVFPDGRRYFALSAALRALLGGRARRAPLDAGFSCPNRDGSVGTGGCLFCDASGARASHVRPELPPCEQLRSGIERSLARDPKTRRFIAYFQAYTNTHAAPAELRRIYSECLSPFPARGALDADPESDGNRFEVSAVAVGTRPDCLSEPVLDVLEELGERRLVWVEMGLQSAQNDTLRRLNRGHTVERFIDAARRLNARGLRWVGHVMLGLPGDGLFDIRASAALLNDLGAWGVKLHNLYVDRHSPLAVEWREGRLAILGRDLYLELVADYLARLSPEIVVHRLLGEAPKESLLAPAWSGNKSTFLRDLDRLLEERELWQGKFFRREDGISVPDKSSAGP
jgi:radical SAM protein (TIGR01212 family)